MPSPPNSPLRPRISNLPVQLTSFVGRRRELADLKRLLAGARLLTLTGPGGVGKTRLAVRAAADQAPHYRDGVWLVDLASVQDPLLVTDAVVAAFGIQDESSRWSVSTLTDYLADKRLLLILDNCEHVLDSTALLAGTLLRACPDLRIVGTSRQALGVTGERIHAVLPLSLPDGDQAAPEAALRSDAVALFVERAAGMRSGFVLDERNLTAVLATCRRLDGIPLALELAAVRAQALGVDALAAGIGEQILALGTGDRSAAPRQHTLQATIEWSYRLLSGPEQRLWTRLSVFSGGCELDAAELVCADDDLPARDIPALLALLVEKSLVQREERGVRGRFRILEVLREFGRQQLTEAGSAAPFLARHTAWMEALTAQVWANDARQGELFGRIRDERANVWAALDFCLQDASNAERGIAICRNLWAYWQTERPVSDVLRILDALMERAGSDSPATGTALWVSAFLVAIQRDAVAADERAARALTIGRAARDAELVAWARTAAGVAAWHRERWQDAERAATDGFALGQAMDLPMASLVARYVLACVRMSTGDLDDALAVGAQAIELSEGLGETWVRSYLYNLLAEARLHQGQVDDATSLARQCLRLRQGLGDVTGMAQTIGLLVSIAVAGHAPARAATLVGGTESIWRSLTGAAVRPPRPALEQAAAAAREVLGEARFQSAVAAGMAMSREALIDFALNDAPVAAGSGARRAARTTGPLSRRELEIAHLVADGASNGETATRLFISERTVESHVASIFNKLGLDSRVQLTRWVASLEAPAET